MQNDAYRRLTLAMQRVVAYGLQGVAYDPLRADPRFAVVIRALKLDVARLTLPDGGRSRYRRLRACRAPFSRHSNEGTPPAVTQRWRGW